MIIEEHYGDIFQKIYEDRPLGTNTHRILAHGCNAKGVMGAGFAKQIKNRFPDCFKEYRNRILSPYAPDDGWTGKYIDWRAEDDSIEIFNCITQELPGPYARVEYIEQCLEAIYSDLMDDYQACIPVYMPRIGCGIGGLDYVTDVKPIFEASKLKIIVCHIFT